MRRREHPGCRLARSRRAVDETELGDRPPDGLVGIPTAAAEVDGLEPAIAKPVGVAANTLGWISSGRPSVGGARPVRVEPERRTCSSGPGAIEPRLLWLSVLDVGRTNQRDHIESARPPPLQRVEALPG